MSSDDISGIQAAASGPGPRLHLDGDGADACAEGVQRPDGTFVVYAKSFGVMETEPSFWDDGDGAADAKAALMRMGAIVIDDATLKLAQDCEFASASEAATVLLGEAADGGRAWKTLDGVTLAALGAVV